jgi:uncharacterized protein (DUF1800 family)
MKRRTCAFLLTALAVITSSCGGGSRTSTPPPPPSVTVQVNPSSAQLLTGETQQFNATVSGTTNTAVTWSVNGLAGGNSTVGSINSSGLYTAPAAAPASAVTVTATSAASSSATASSAVTVTAPLVTDFAASRFLDQATFGATPASIRQVKLVGFQQFLADQFAATSSTYPDPPDSDPSTNSPAPYQQRFITNALTGPDQLRQRVAFALQKIWVVSWVVVNTDEGFLSYLRMHQQHPFAAYRQIMENVTTNPAMGQYQDIANNAGVNITGSPPAISCNENYGRELMQLFTIGVWQLNQDATFTTTPPTATYDQPIVEANACALTGWTYANAPGATPRTYFRNRYFGAPLEPVDAFHDRSSKTLLNGLVLPAGQSALLDMRATLDNLNTYPSIAPFVSRMLIQQFTTSNPSPVYISRVAQAFIDGRYVASTRTFGSGTRGDMQAIMAAILLDAEARAGDVPGNSPPTFGKLREPVLLVLGALRGLGVQSDGAAVRTLTTAMGQNLFFPPTVFSYFSPEYSIPGTALLGPEFNIQNSSTALARANFVNTLAFGSLGTGTTFDIAPWGNLAQTSTTALLDELDRVFLHGTMSSQVRASITTALNVIPSSNPQQRARNAIYLVLTSSQYNVQR